MRRFFTSIYCLRDRFPRKTTLLTVKGLCFHLSLSSLFRRRNPSSGPNWKPCMANKLTNGSFTTCATGSMLMVVSQRFATVSSATVGHCELLTYFKAAHDLNAEPDAQHAAIRSHIRSRPSRNAHRGLSKPIVIRLLRFNRQPSSREARSVAVDAGRLVRSILGHDLRQLHLRKHPLLAWMLLM